MQMLDASSIIFAWENYSETQFPSLWVWLAYQVSRKSLTIARCAFDEVQHKTPECAAWLETQVVEKFDVTDAILQFSARIATLLGIENDRYHPKGVGANDIIIIATARIFAASLICNEGVQVSALLVPSKRKIPAVCAMQEVNVECMSFLQYIKRSKTVFE